MSTRHRPWAPVLGLIALLLAICAAALWLPEDSRPRQIATVAAAVAPTAVAVWQYAYYRIERHRLFVDRAHFWVTNRESEWSLTAEFDVADLRGAFDQAVAAIDKLPNTARLSDGPGNVVWQIAGSTVRVAGDTAADHVGVITVEFPPAPRQFRMWPTVIGGTVDTVIDTVQSTLPQGRRKFVATIGFPGDNPYFGFFIANSPPTTVQRFDIELVEPRASGADRVLVRQNRIELVTSTMPAVRQLSERYLELRPMGAN